LAVANSTASTLFGIFDVLAYVERQSLSTQVRSISCRDRWRGEGPLALASGVTVEVQRAIETSMRVTS
jgi:hypothetical protein